MMHDPWPPQPPPDFEPPPRHGPANALLLVLLAAVAVGVLVAAIAWSVMVVGALRDGAPNMRTAAGEPAAVTSAPQRF